MQAWFISRLRRPRFVQYEHCLRGFASGGPKLAEKERGSKDAIEEDPLLLDTRDSEGADDGAQEDFVASHGRDELSYAEEKPAEPDLKPDDVRPPFMDAFTAVPGDVRTHRSRRHGNKPLPLPPAIDPVFVAARNRWQTKKALPPKPDAMTPFQKKLSVNPYAKILATPVRETPFTDSHLPRFFLLPLDMRRSPHPPYTPMWIPSRLWAQTNGLSTDVSKGHVQTYIDLTSATMDILSTQESRLKNSIASIAAARSFTYATRKDMVVMPELGNFVQDLLRKEVLKRLAFPIEHPNAKLIERCDDGAYAIREREDGGEDVACVLYTAPMDSPLIKFLAQRVRREVLEAEVLGRRLRRTQMWMYGRLLRDDRTPNTPFPGPMQNIAAVYPPFRYQTVQNSMGTPVPVYGLYEMLGEEGLKGLLEGTTFEDARCLVLRTGGGDGKTVKAQMALLRLLHFRSQDLFVRHLGAHWVRGTADGTENEDSL